MSNYGYELAWRNLKEWLETQREYQLIPVSMIMTRMNLNEDTYIEE